MLIDHDEHTKIKYNTGKNSFDHSRTTCGIAWRVTIVTFNGQDCSIN